MLSANGRDIGRVFAILAGAALWLSGCTSLPDVSPFATATRSLADAVRASGKAVEREAGLIKDGKELADSFAGEWNARNKVMESMQNYAASLSAIVDAANRGRETGKALAGKTEELAVAAGLIPGGGAAVKVASDVAAGIIAQISLMRGAKSLEEALAAGQPIIEAVARKLAADFASLDRLARNAEKNQDGQVLDDESFRAALDAEGAALAAKQSILVELAKSSDATGLTKSPKLLAQLAEIEKILAATRVTLAPGEEKQRAMKRRITATRELIAASADTLGRWATAHQDLVYAIQNRRPVDVSSILQAVDEVRELVKRVKQL